MKTLSRSGEINYYDELGVSSNASQDEIRDTFRALVRLLHPDQQTDKQLKKIAEGQMRKLNPIYAILSDPERRKRYDQDLQDRHPRSIIVSNAPPADFNRFLGKLAWIAAIVLSAGVLIWLASANSPIPQGKIRIDNSLDLAPVPKSPSNPVESALEIDQLQADLRTTATQRDTALSELAALRARAVAPPSRTQNRQEDHSAPVASITELSASPRIQPSASQVARADPAPLETSGIEGPGVDTPRRETGGTKTRLSGFWFYVKPAQGQKNKNQTLYLPEYIEASINEVDGVLRGSYRSRFQIMDKAISPEVNFSFTAAPTGPVINCPWTGPGGARGDLTLRLLSENSVRVDWKATELGTQQGLISGTAILTRKLD